MILSRSVNEEVNDRLIEIINSLFKIEKSVLREYQQAYLTSEIFGLRYYDLALLFFVIEDQFKIEFDENDIKKYGFHSIEEITSIVIQKL